MKEKSFFEKKAVMVAVTIFCCILWASAIPTIKISYQEINISEPFAKVMFAGIRFSISGILVLLANRIIFKKKVFSKENNWGFFITIALLQTVFTYSAYYIGLGNVTAVKASIDFTVNIFLVVLLSHFFLKNEKLNLRVIIGMILGFLGVITVNINTISGIDWEFLISGDGLIILSGVFMAVASIAVKLKSEKSDVVLLNGWQLLMGGVILTVIGYIGYPHIPVFNIKAVFLLLYLSFVSAAAFTLWYILLKYHKVSEITLYKFIIPSLATALAALLLKEEVFKYEIIFALLLVSSGIIIVNLKEGKLKRKSINNIKDIS